jgi:hypothetical protein
VLLYRLGYCTLCRRLHISWRSGEQLLLSALLQYPLQHAPGAAGTAAIPGPVLAISSLDTPWMTTPGVFSAFAAIGSLTSLQQSMSAHCMQTRPQQRCVLRLAL